MEQQDISARVEAHLPLVQHAVIQLAAQFPRHVDREDLARAGALGLVEAARRYDPQLGVPFEGYARQRIRGAILDATRTVDWAPRSLRRLARRIDAARQSLASELGRLPTLDEVAAAVHETRERVHEVEVGLHRSVVFTLDRQAGEEGHETTTLGDTIVDRTAVEPSDSLEMREMYGYLRDAVTLLPERHRMVVMGYFLVGKTSLELARYLGVTESRISQLRSEALRMLKEVLEAQFDDPATPAPPVKGRVAQRKAAYARAVARSRSWAERLEESAWPLLAVPA